MTHKKKKKNERENRQPKQNILRNLRKKISHAILLDRYVFTEIRILRFDVIRNYLISYYLITYLRTYYSITYLCTIT